MASVDRKGAGKVLRLILKKCGDLGHGESLRLTLYGLNPKYLFKLLRFNSEFLRVQF